MDTLYKVLIVGSTGLVGKKLLDILIELKFPYSEIFLTIHNNASSNYDGNDRIKNISLNENSFDGIDFCFFCSTNEISEIWGPIAKLKCKYVIDNSSFYRMDKKIPLVIPEINFDKIDNNLIANPNCSTIQSLLVLNEIKKEYKINKIIYNTYQSCSGGGKEELKELIKSYSGFSSKYSKLLCDTCISQIGDIKENKYSLEEMKMINETRKVFDDYNLKVHASCIRVPVSYCHGIFIYVETDEDININKIITLIDNSKRLKYVKDNEIMYFQDAYEEDFVLVGRIKKDLTNNKAFSLFCIGDNLRIGAALNAYNIAINLTRRNDEKNKKRST